MLCTTNSLLFGLFSRRCYWWGYNPTNFIFTGQIDLNIPTGSTIRKAFLFSSATKHYDVTDFPEPRIIVINGQPVNVSMEDALYNNYTDELYGSPQPTYEMRTVVKDITHLTLSSINTITPPSQVLPPFYWEYYILVLYEDNLLPYTAVDVFINTQDADSLMNYSLNTAMTIDVNNDIGLAINTSHFCDTVQDGSYVFIEGNSIGLIGGDDYNVPTIGGCAGTTGGFYYENSTLFGLGDDTPDEFMSGSDVLAKIQNYITNNQQVNTNFAYQSNFRATSNPINQLYLTYTSPCDTFSVTVPNDTTVCEGTQLQLNASASNPSATYEWLPSTGLSCSACPNPIFTADSSMFYTVRIWNNDSCSVVRPVKINVRPKPTFGTITIMPSECGDLTGSATLLASPNNGVVLNWQEVGGVTQTSNVFQNLSTGYHTFFFIDTNGCQSTDTTIFIGEINSSIASFSVSPQSGVAPLSVNVTNTSQNASNFEWFTSTSSVITSNGVTPPSYFNPSGEYEIMLIAWENDPSCADTAYASIIVSDRLIIPTAFTPNNDQVHDFWEIPHLDEQYPQNVVFIYNRWGNLIFQSNSGKYNQQPWDGTYKGEELPVGSYYFIIQLNDENTDDIKGNVTIMRE